jgi:hypothetical protein
LIAEQAFTPRYKVEEFSGGMARVFVLKSDLNCLNSNSEIIVIDPATFDKRRFSDNSQR